MRKVVLTIELDFADKIVSDNDHEEVSIKVLDALVHEVNCGNGLAPDNSDTFTKSISVHNNVINTTISKSF